MTFDYLTERITSHPNADAPFERHGVTQSDIESAERRIGRSFPSGLKNFWLEVGAGYIKRSIDDDGFDNIVDSFSFPPPDVVATEIETFPDRFSTATPFFDLSDDCWFVLLSDNQVAWDDNHSDIISGSFEDFVSKIVRNPYFWKSQTSDIELKQ